MSVATLYVCATPIGNLSDISKRLIETLNSVSIIAAEDTRVASILLQHLQIKKSVISIEKFSEVKRTTTLLRYLEKGDDIALVSDAGTPNISDPGAYLVTRVCAEGYNVVPISGPSAVTTFLSAAGFLANHFYFAGFFPKKEAEVRTVLTALTSLCCPIVFFESGKRIIKTLSYLNDHVPVTEIVVAKELTKKHERFFRGSVDVVLQELSKSSLKGEFIFALTLSTENTQEVDVIINQLKECGLDNKQILSVAKTCFGLNRNHCYAVLNQNN